MVVELIFATRRAAVLAASVLLVALSPAAAAPVCEQPLARVASVQGAVDVRRGTEWLRAELQQALCAGDVVRVGERSRAALLMSNQTTLRLDQHTSLTLLPSDAPQATVIEQLRGIVNVITRTPRPFRLTTPFVNANVEGTEFLVNVAERESSVLVYEGKVVASNQAGRIALGAGEVASGPADVPPRKSLAVRPADAVQWALHYPTLRPRVGADLPAVREAAALSASGRADEAIARLDAVPAAGRNGAWRLQRAALLLEVGRADQALPDLSAIAATEAAYAESLSLRAIVALVQNDAAGALSQAEAAVAADGRSATARLAASYVQQSRLELDAAAVHAREAVALEPANALGWARVAELLLYAGRTDEAIDAAQRAVAADAELARAHSVFGFTLLGRFHTEAARSSFERAIRLDQGDPLPHIGLGLALIREGRLHQGREEIEIAVCLDPENSLLRSYLGKAYAEEGRSRHAGTQFALAKERDPLDPTPWFYDAMRKLMTNRPVEALEDVTRSIALNDNRAVYRSRLLLEDDLAVRGASLARVYDELGFGALAVAEATKSLSIDPGAAAAHRFLADAYSSLDRHEVASASEQLQALMMQPVQAAHIAPRRTSAPVMSLIDPSLLGVPDDHTRLFDRTGTSGQLGLAVGSRGLWSAEASASYASERFALSAGAFRYHTDGFRENSDVTHRIDNVLLQTNVLPTLNLQFELIHRRSLFGYVQQQFEDDDNPQPDRRQDIHQHTARFGLTWRPAAEHLVMLSHQDQRSDDSQLLLKSPYYLDVSGSAPGHVTEIQYRWLGNRSNIVLGASSSRADFDTISRVDDPLALFGGVCTPSCIQQKLDSVEETQVYGYWNYRLTPSLSTVLGVAHERRESEGGVTDDWNPKLGVLWLPNESLTVRAASFRTLKRGLVVERTIEPTQVAGFNQFYDDQNGARAHVNSLAVDARLRPDLRLTAQIQRREVRRAPGLLGSGLNWSRAEEWIERQAGMQVFWTPTPRIAARAGLSTDRFSRIPLQMDVLPTRVHTTSLPIAIRHFWPQGVFAEMAVTRVLQRVERQSTGSDRAGRDRFTLVDMTVGMRLPTWPATVTLTAKNLLGEQFRYEDDLFRSSSVRQGRYLPARSVVIATQMSF